MWFYIFKWNRAENVNHSNFSSIFRDFLHFAIYFLKAFHEIYARMDDCDFVPEQEHEIDSIRFKFLNYGCQKREYDIQDFKKDVWDLKNLFVSSISYLDLYTYALDQNHLWSTKLCWSYLIVVQIDGLTVGAAFL